MSFGLNAQVASVALVGAAAGGWPPSPQPVGYVDQNQLLQVDADNWIIENVTLAEGGCKLRANNTWGGAGGEWAGAFPTAVGTSSGDIAVPIAGLYTVTLNTATGVYNFESGTPLPTVKLVGAATGTVDGIVMAPFAADIYRATNVTLLDGAGQFSIQSESGPIELFGETTFPTGTLMGATDNIPVVAGVYSSVTLNTNNGDYTFVLAPIYSPVGLIGSGTTGTSGGWTQDIDMTTTDGENYSLTGQQLFSVNSTDSTPGGLKFRQNNDWVLPSFGGTSFPTGPIAGNNENIIVTVDGTYNVSFNLVTGAYTFYFPSVALVGPAAGGWPSDPQIDTNVLTTTDGVNYTLSNFVTPGGECKFRQQNNWSLTNWGDPNGPGGNILLEAGTFNLTLNILTGVFTVTPSLATTSFNTNTFKVFPNPTSNVWSFVSTSAKNIVTIAIVDLLGKTVMTIAPAATSANVDATTITNGLYFAKVTTTSGTETVKLMKN